MTHMEHFSLAIVLQFCRLKKSCQIAPCSSAIKVGRWIFIGPN